jgi:hypothetical protein
MECKTCRWRERKTLKHGLCRRFPPQVIVTSEEDVQPVSEQDDYCGEYAQAPTDPPTAAT